MQRAFRILVLIIAIIMCIPLHALAVELITAAQNSAPKYYKTADGRMAGLCVEILHAIMQEDPGIVFTGYQEFVPFKRLLLQLEHGELDLFMGLRKTDDRRGKFIFLDVPLYELNYVLACHKEDTVTIQSFDDVRALGDQGWIITVFGSAAGRFLANQGGLLIIDGAETPSIMLKMLHHKRGRFAFYHDLGMQSLLNTTNGGRAIRVLPVSFLTYHHYAAFSRNVPANVREKVAHVLAQLRKRGVLKQIHQNYMSGH